MTTLMTDQIATGSVSTSVQRDALTVNAIGSMSARSRSTHRVRIRGASKRRCNGRRRGED